MTTIEQKYKIGTRRFGRVNWIGLYTLYLKEVLRFFNVWIQTILSPIVTFLLFLGVFSLAIGNGRADVLGYKYTIFLVPGLIVMQMMQNSFANTSTSLIQQKLNENIVDTLMPPLSPMELTTGFVLGGATRGLMVAVGVGISLALLVPVSLHHPAAIIFYAIGAALMFGSMGMMTGIWAEKFDHVSTITNFIILPLSFLSVTFFPITRFPEIFKIISHYNPFFYLIDGLRYGYTSQSAGSIGIGIVLVINVNVILWVLCYWMFSTGYKIKE